MDLRDERELAYQRLLCICKAGFLSILDFRLHPTSHELLRFFWKALAWVLQSLKRVWHLTRWKKIYTTVWPSSTD